MAGEKENARGRNIKCCIYTRTPRKIDRMVLFIPSHLLLYVRGETAVNRKLLEQAKTFFTPFFHLVWNPKHRLICRHVS